MTESPLNALIRSDRQAAMKALRDDPRLATVASACWSSERLIAYVQAQGWETLDEAMGALAADRLDLKAHARIANPRPSFRIWDNPAAISRPFTYYHRLIHNTIQGDPALPIKLKDGYAIRQVDGWCSAPTHDQLLELASICPVRGDDYAWEHRDCDDHNVLTKAWLTLNGLATLAAFQFDYVAYQGDTLLGGHTLLICADNKDHLWFWDPRSGRIEPLTCTTLGGFDTATRLQGVGIYG